MNYIGINTETKTVGINLDNVFAIMYDKETKKTKFYTKDINNGLELEDDGSLYNNVADKLGIGRVE